MKKKEINYQLLIRRICLIVLDIICIIAASILALLTRFEFDFSQIPKEFLKVIYKYGPFTIVITLIIFSLFRIYSSLWEYAGIEEVFSLIAACLAAAVAKIVIILFTWSVMPRSWYVLDTIYLMILIGATRVSYRLIRLRRQNRTFPWSKRKKVMIIGGGEAGRSLITEIQNSKYLDQKVVCIIDDDPYKIGRYIKGVKVVGNRNSIKKSVKKYNVQQIILTIPSANAAKIRPIVEICQDTNCELMILPGVYQLVNGEVRVSKLRPVNIDDLLGRDEVYVNLNEVMDYVSGRVIMVTGGGGSIGSELCRQIAKHSPKQLIIFDIYENNAYDIQQELLREQPKLDLVVLIGSVRDENRINSIFEQYRPEIIDGKEVYRDPDTCTLRVKELKDGSTKDSVLINGPVGEIIAMRERIFYIDMEDHNVLKSVTYDGRKRKTWTKDPVKQFAVIGEYVICCTEDEKLIRCDMSTGKKKELADHIQYFFAGAKLYAQKGSKIVSVSYDGKEVRVFKKDVVMMDKKEDKVYYRRMDRKKEQMYVCDVDGGMEKMVGSRD